MASGVVSLTPPTGDCGIGGVALRSEPSALASVAAAAVADGDAGLGESWPHATVRARAQASAGVKRQVQFIYKLSKKDKAEGSVGPKLLDRYDTRQVQESKGDMLVRRPGFVV
jgi:hypothetical protein